MGVCAMGLFFSTFSRETCDSIEIYVEIHLEKLVEDARYSRRIVKREIGVAETLVTTHRISHVS